MHAGRILLVPGSGLGESMRDHTHSFPGQGVTRGQNESVATGRTLSGHRSTGRSGVSVVWCGLGGARAQLGKGLVCLAYRRSLSPPQAPTSDQLLLSPSAPAGGSGPASGGSTSSPADEGNAGEGPGGVTGRQMLRGPVSH